MNKKTSGTREQTGLLLFIILNLVLTGPAFSQCRIVDFERTAGFQPADDLQFRRQFQATQNITFSLDTNNDMVGDQPAILEAVGNQAGECNPSPLERTCGFSSSVNGNFDTSWRPGLLGRFFLRMRDRNPPTSLIIDFTNPEGVAVASGEIWDIDGDLRRTEQERWRVEAFDSGGNVIDRVESPLGLHPTVQGSLDSRPWRWNLAPSNGCPIFKIKIAYTGTGRLTRFVGLAFDNMSFCDVTPAFDVATKICSNEALQLVADTASTPPAHQWDLIPSDGDGTTDSNLTGDSVHRCWGPQCRISPPIKPGNYVVKHGIFSSWCLPWLEDREEVSVVAAPEVDAGPDQKICAGGTVRLPANCTPPDVLPLGFWDWSPDDTIISQFDSFCVRAQPVETTAYTVRHTNALTRCEAEDSTLVEVLNKPDPKIEIDGPCCARSLRAVGSDLRGVRWNTGASTAEISVTGTGTYTVVASNECGEAAASRRVNAAGVRGSPGRIIAGPVFRPPTTWAIWDRDKDPDVRPSYGATKYRLWIFDRTGTAHLVSQGSHCAGLRNGEITWDGRINGRIVKQDVYNWVLQLKNCRPCVGTLARPESSRVCVRRILGVCVKRETRIDTGAGCSKTGAITVLR